MYELKFKVRDYECDLQGIVNNANYQHYMEHARHEFLLERGVSFAELHEQGIDAMVVRINISYKVPLKSRDEFIVRLHVKKEGIRYVFYEDILRLQDMKICCRAQVDTVCVIHSRLGTTPELDALCQEFENK